MTKQLTPTWPQSAYVAETLIETHGLAEVIYHLWMWEHLARDPRPVAATLSGRRWTDKRKAEVWLYEIQSGCFYLLAYPDRRDPTRPPPTSEAATGHTAIL